MITIRISGPKGDVPEMAGELAEMLRAKNFNICRHNNHNDGDTRCPAGTDVKIIITQEE